MERVGRAGGLLTFRGGGSPQIRGIALMVIMRFERKLGRLPCRALAMGNDFVFTSLTICVVFFCKDINASITVKDFTGQRALFTSQVDEKVLFVGAESVARLPRGEEACSVEAVVLARGRAEPSQQRQVPRTFDFILFVKVLIAAAQGQELIGRCQKSVWARGPPATTT